jgi:phospholipase/carboxylesterase
VEFPQAFVVSVAAPHRSEFGQGRQWFSVVGIDDELRLQRVAEAMPAFTLEVRRWQAESGVGAEATALIGFSQGAIMALESTQTRGRLAGRVVALAGRFASAPGFAPPDTTLHLIHGKADPVIHYGHTVSAAERLVALGADLTADVIPFLGHAVDAEALELVVERLKGYLPRRRWEEAMRAAPPDHDRR